MHVEPPQNPEIRLAIGYAPAAARTALTTLFALDTRLAGIVARASEPAIGLMRLVWWRDALEALDEAAPPAEPLLAACAGIGVAGAALAAMTAGWEALLDDPEVAPETVALHAAERGARLFAIAGTILGAPAPRLAPAGEGWARVDLARHLSGEARVSRTLASAREPLDAALATRWPGGSRAIGQLAALARDDARRGVPGQPGSRRRLLRILAFQLTGR